MLTLSLFCCLSSHSRWVTFVGSETFLTEHPLLLSLVDNQHATLVVCSIQFIVFGSLVSLPLFLAMLKTVGSSPASRVVSWKAFRLSYARGESHFLLCKYLLLLDAQHTLFISRLFLNIRDAATPRDNRDFSLPELVFADDPLTVMSWNGSPLASCDRDAGWKDLSVTPLFFLLCAFEM